MHACVLSHVHFLATLWTVAARLLCPWDFPGKNTGVGYHFLLQGIFPTQGLNPGLLRWQVGSLPLHQLGSIPSWKYTFSLHLFLPQTWWKDGDCGKNYEADSFWLKNDDEPCPCLKNAQVTVNSSPPLWLLSWMLFYHGSCRENSGHILWKAGIFRQWWCALAVYGLIHEASKTKGVFLLAGHALHQQMNLCLWWGPNSIR